MDSLMSKPTAGDIKLALQNLPKGMEGLDVTYEQTMKRINSQEEGFQEIAKQVLSWLIHTKRQLTAIELQHVLAVRISMKELDKDFIPEVGVLLSICAGLVTVGENSIIRLVHYTMQEYFERTWTSWFPNAQIDITNVCVTYLSFNVFETGFCQSDEEFEARLQTSVLYDYAARNWGYHAYTASVEGGLIEEDLILNLLKSRAKVSATSQAMMASGGYSGYSQSVPKQMTGIHIAAYFGLVGTIMSLLKDGYNLDLQDSYSQTPLLWAARRGHKAVVKLLLEKGAELESKDGSGQTPLLWTAGRGHEAVVKLLLEKGAELESMDSNFGQTPLLWAARRGHEAVVKLLLKKGAKLESKDVYGQTPLLGAVDGGTRP
jgi:Ankyrin repeats (3 copies)/Ankyrin repeats (many copies)